MTPRLLGRPLPGAAADMWQQFHGEGTGLQLFSHLRNGSKPCLPPKGLGPSPDHDLLGFLRASEWERSPRSAGTQTSPAATAHVTGGHTGPSHP